MADNKSLFGTSYQRVTTPAEFERGMLGQAAADGIAMASMLPTDPLAASARLGVAQAPVLAEMGTSSLRKLFGLEDPRVTQAQEAQRQSNEAFVMRNKAELTRLQAALDNTTDPRVRRELASLAPLIVQGNLVGADLTTAIDNSIERYTIEPLTATELASLGRLVDEDPQLKALIEKPGIIARLFGAENPEQGREGLIREIGRLKQLYPNLSDKEVINQFLADVSSEIVIEGEGNVNELPRETVTSETVTPYRSKEEIEEAAVKEGALTKAEIKQIREDINELLDKEQYPESGQRRSKEFSRLFRLALLNRGVQVPTGVSASDLSRTKMPEDMSGYGDTQAFVTRRNVDEANRRAFLRRFAGLLSTTPQSL